MSLLIPDALGREERFYAMRESTFGTQVVPAAVAGSDSVAKQGGMLVLKSQFNTKSNRVNRADKRGTTRSHKERISRMIENTWSMETYVLPPETGDSTRDPDCSALFLAAMGVRARTANSLVRYTLGAGQTSLGSLSLMREASSVVSEALTGAWVDEMKISLAGGDEPKVAFSGGAKHHIHTSYTTLYAEATGGAASIEVVNADNLENGSIITVGSSTNHVLSAKTATSGQRATFTVTPVISGTQAVSSDVVPYVPTFTSNGSAIAGIEGSILIGDSSPGGTALDISAFELTLKNNIKPLNNLAFYQEVPDIIPGVREVSGEVTVRAKRDTLHLLGTRKDFTTQFIRVTCGSTSGLRMLIDVRCELEFGGLELPESDEGYYKLPFFGLASSSGEDELIIDFF